MYKNLGLLCGKTINEIFIQISDKLDDIEWAEDPDIGRQTCKIHIELNEGENTLPSIIT
jgi:hypothetical protein